MYNNSNPFLAVNNLSSGGLEKWIKYTEFSFWCASKKSLIVFVSFVITYCSRKLRLYIYPHSLTYLNESVTDIYIFVNPLQTFSNRYQLQSLAVSRPKKKKKIKKYDSTARHSILQFNDKIIVDSCFIQNKARVLQQ